MDDGDRRDVATYLRDWLEEQVALLRPTSLRSYGQMVEDYLDRARPA